MFRLRIFQVGPLRIQGGVLILLHVCWCMHQSVHCKSCERNSSHSLFLSDSFQILQLFLSLYYICIWNCIFDPSIFRRVMPLSDREKLLPQFLSDFFQFYISLFMLCLIILKLCKQICPLYVASTSANFRYMQVSHQTGHSGFQTYSRWFVYFQSFEKK